MDGHTSQFGPHLEQKWPESLKKRPAFFQGQSREHILLLLVLLFFSVNIALAFTRAEITSSIVDDIPLSSQSASIFRFLKF